MIVRAAALAVLMVCGLYGSQSVAYISDGAVWLKPLSGAPPKKLSTPGHCSRPRFSASGKYVSAECDGVLWVFDGQDGSKTRIGPGSGEWAPKSDRIVWTSTAGSYILSASGGWHPDRPFTTMPAHVWNGDETMLAGWRHLTGPPHMPVADLLFRIPIDGEPVLLAREPAELSPLFWTASNDLVLTVNEGFSASVAADGLPLRAISSDGRTFDLGVVMLSGGDMLSVTPDRERLAAAAGSDRSTFSNKWIVVYDFRSRALRSLTSRDGTSSISPVWSGDGQRIAYASSATAEMGARRRPARRIWVMRADGSAKQRITNEAGWSDEHPLWTDGDRAVLFCRRSDDRSGGVWMVQADGGSPPRRVADHIDFPGPEYYGYVEWTRVLDVSGRRALAPDASTR